MIDLGNVILKYLIEFLPFVNNSIGVKYQSIATEINSNKLFLTFPSQINNFYIKNNVIKIEKIAGNIFLVNFKNEVTKNVGDDIALKGFSNIAFNGIFQILEKRQNAVKIKFNTDSFTGSLGFSPSLYNNINGLKTINLEGNNKISFLLDPNLSQEMDTDYLPLISDLNENVKLMNFQTFKSNESMTGENIIIDSTSFIGSPVRSATNNTDKPYNIRNANGNVEFQYNASIYYSIIRDENSNINQTDSGSDITSKQFAMLNSLQSILLNVNYYDKKIKVDPVVIINNLVDEAIKEGSVYIRYDILISVEISLDYYKLSIFNIGSKINFLQINTDTIKLND